MAPHAVAEDADAVRVHLLEVFEDGPRQLRRDVAVHFVSLAPRGLCRVDVETRAAAEVVRVVFALDLEASCDEQSDIKEGFGRTVETVWASGHTWARVRVENCNSLLARGVLEETLLGSVVARTGQAGEVYQEGSLVEGVRGRLGGQVEVEGHFAIGGGGVVGEFEQFASKGCDCCFCLYRHGRCG